MDTTTISVDDFEKELKESAQKLMAAIKARQTTASPTELAQLAQALLGVTETFARIENLRYARKQIQFNMDMAIKNQSLSPNMLPLFQGPGGPVS